MTHQVSQRDVPHGAASQIDGAVPGPEGVPHSSEATIAKGLPPDGFLKELSRAISSAGSAVTGFIDLVALEARGAGVALVWMIAGSLLAVVFLVGAWLALLAAAAIWAISLGVSAVWVALGVAAINLLGGAVLVHRCIAMSRALLFSATRRQLAVQFSAKPRLP